MEQKISMEQDLSFLSLLQPINLIRNGHFRHFRLSSIANDGYKCIILFISSLIDRIVDELCICDCVRDVNKSQFLLSPVL